MQIELLDRHLSATRAELATAIFEYIEAFYNPMSRHSALDCQPPSTTKDFTPRSNTAARAPNSSRPGHREQVKPVVPSP